MSIDESIKLTTELMTCIKQGRGGPDWQDRFHSVFHAHANPDSSLETTEAAKRMNVLSRMLVQRRPAEERILRMRYSGKKIMSYRNIADALSIDKSKVIRLETKAIDMSRRYLLFYEPNALLDIYNKTKESATDSSHPVLAPDEITEERVRQAIGDIRYPPVLK